MSKREKSKIRNEKKNNSRRRREEEVNGYCGIPVDIDQRDDI
ncbi:MULTISPECIES: hypothetical protein [Acidianus]|nr:MULTISPECIES: hypothetical protein [Acidianus]